MALSWVSDTILTVSAFALLKRYTRFLIANRGTDARGAASAGGGRAGTAVGGPGVHDPGQREPDEVPGLLDLHREILDGSRT
jgi:hypothetical protein